MIRAQDRARANNRIYCDNDPMSPDETQRTRWQLREDPPPYNRPENFVPNRERPRYPNFPFGPHLPGSSWVGRHYPQTLQTYWHLSHQEWEDRENHVYMFYNVDGCHRPGVLSATYTQRPSENFWNPVPPQIPWVRRRNVKDRATITICDEQFAMSWAPSLSAIARKGQNLEFLTKILSPRGVFFIEILGRITSFTILRALLQSQPWEYTDAWHIVDEGLEGWHYEYYLSWEEVQRNAETGGTGNRPNNLAFFALLVALADYGYYLRPRVDEDNRGRVNGSIIFYDPSVIPVRSYPILDDNLSDVDSYPISTEDLSDSERA
ncbi:MAG: hypothetical protein Q9227_001776 [Pyrenula ochraceoflavens]